MLDIKFIRENKEAVKKNCKLRNIACDIDRLLELDEKRRKFVAEIGDLKEKKNAINEKIKSGENKENLIVEGKTIKENLDKLEPEFEEIEKEYKEILYKVPNIISSDTPIGSDESGNKVIRKWGEIPEFDFQPKEHWEIGKELDIIDIERAAKVSGSRFNYLKGGAVLLEFALVQHAFSVLTDENILKEIIEKNNLDVSAKPFVPVVPPVMIKYEPMKRMARHNPEEMFQLERDELSMVGSAEHTLGAMYMDENIKEEDLPLRLIGFSTAFRREAGSYGKDTKGILRVHQFDKLEMESFSLPEKSIAEQDFIVSIQEYLMRSLNLPHRVVAICTGDMGDPDYRQIDIETWLPGQDKYRETHTADLMNDYQSRRLGTKVIREDGRLEYVHMNDATAFAIGRTIIAIIENGQQADGSVAIPEVLRQYMPGKMEVIKKNG